jgi:hypothetical protein
MGELEEIGQIDVGSHDVLEANATETRRAKKDPGESRRNLFDLPELPDTRRRKTRKGKRATKRTKKSRAQEPLRTKDGEAAQHSRAKDPAYGESIGTSAKTGRKKGSPEEREEDSDDDVPELKQREEVSDDESSSDEEEALLDSSDEEGGVVKKRDYNNPAKTLDTSAPYIIKPSKRNHAVYARYFPGTNLDTIKATFEATTQLGTKGAVDGFTLRNRIVAPNPVLSIPRRHEDLGWHLLFPGSVGSSCILSGIYGIPLESGMTRLL